MTPEEILQQIAKPRYEWSNIGRTDATRRVVWDIDAVLLSQFLHKQQSDMLDLMALTHKV